MEIFKRGISCAFLVYPALQCVDKCLCMKSKKVHRRTEQDEFPLQQTTLLLTFLKRLVSNQASISKNCA